MGSHLCKKDPKTPSFDPPSGYAIAATLCQASKGLGIGGFPTPVDSDGLFFIPMDGSFGFGHPSK